MGDIRFSKGHYKDALEYTKDILKMSSSIEEIVINAKEIDKMVEKEDIIKKEE